MKSTFFIMFFGLALGGCAAIEAGIPSVEHADWIGERRDERLTESSAPVSVPENEIGTAKVQDMMISTVLLDRMREQLDAIDANRPLEPETGSADSFREEGRQQTTPMD